MKLKIECVKTYKNDYSIIYAKHANNMHFIIDSELHNNYLENLKENNEIEMMLYFVQHQAWAYNIIEKVNTFEIELIEKRKVDEEFRKWSGTYYKNYYKAKTSMGIVYLEEREDLNLLYESEDKRGTFTYIKIIDITGFVE